MKQFKLILRIFITLVILVWLIWEALPLLGAFIAGMQLSDWEHNQTPQTTESVVTK